MLKHLKNLKKRNEGFTIIEVLIVLAIAGLIMMIIFFAVPALQRAQRNEARNNDARLITNAINECLVNRNGVTGSCDSPGEVALPPPPTLRHVTTASHVTTDDPGSLTAATWRFNARCSTDGSSVVSATSREFAVRYQVETATGSAARCISG